MPDIREATAKIVAAYLGKNPTDASQVAPIVSLVFDALASAGNGQSLVPVERAKPYVAIKRSVLPHAIICLDCGWEGKMLRRHLLSAHKLTPDAYKAKWGLSSEYPMLCTSYSQRRSTLAKQIGLGTRHRRGKAPEGESRSAEPATRAPARVGLRKAGADAGSEDTASSTSGTSG